MARTKMVNGVVMDLTAEDLAQCDKDEKVWNDARPAREMRMIREHRDRLLAETDWTANSDVTMSAKMKTYRQMLRDIPASNTVYEDVDWGTKPA